MAISLPLTARPLRVRRKSLQAAFPVRIFPRSPRRKKEYSASVLDSGTNSTVSLTKVDRIGSLLRTSLRSAILAQTSCFPIWQKRTTPLGRSWWVLAIPTRRIGDNGFGLLGARQIGRKHRKQMRLLPSPDSNCWKGSCRIGQRRGQLDELVESIYIDQTGSGGRMRLSPQFVRWMMGYPEHWLDIE